MINFDITSSGNTSQEFISRNCFTFNQAALFVTHLPYRRNTDKNNLLSVFTENCGTCGTKHALLKQLAIENNFPEIKLVIGICKMNAENTPEIAGTLKDGNLTYIPEAHNYLKFNDGIFDYTKPDFKLAASADYIMQETEILPGQITDYKVNYHKAYLKNWLTEQDLLLSLDELWAIREQCIRDLAV